MLLDGVQPSRFTFHFAAAACMRAGRLQDVFFFFNQMKQMGMQPDVSGCIHEEPMGAWLDISTKDRTEDSMMYSSQIIRPFEECDRVLCSAGLALSALIADCDRS